jgi:GxxExxY protein
LRFERQVGLPVVYKGVKLDCGYRMDILVEDLVVLEIKAVEKLIPVHDAQLLTYLKLSDRPVGLIINFCVPVLVNGIRRIAHKLSVSPRLCGESHAATIS